MGFWSVIVPETADVVNLVTNPSVELGTTGYTAVGGSVARSNTASRRGGYSLGVTPTSGTGDGAYYGTVSLVSGTGYTLAFDFKGIAGVTYKAYFATSAGTLKGTATSWTASGEWERKSVTWTADATAAHRLYVIKDGHASTGVFYVDGVNCYALGYEVTYIDGEQAGCRWNGARQASTSTRLYTSRAGGRVYNLDSYGFYLAEFSGMGMAPVSLLSQGQALLPGARLVGHKVEARTFALIGSVIGTSWEDLHAKRHDLIDAIKPDLRRGDQAFWLMYTGASSAKETYIQCVYAGGLEYGEHDGFTEKVGVRLVAHDPWFYELGEASAPLAYEESRGTNYIITEGGTALTPGVWTSPGDALDDAVYAVAVEAAGTILVGGAFNLAGAGTVDYIARLATDYSWSAISNGTNGVVRAIRAAADGTFYLGGGFTGANGVANTGYIAKHNGSNYVALGTGGAGGDVYGIDVAPSGDVYAVGAFTGMGGVANTAKAARWDGSAWNALGTGLNGTGWCVLCAPNGDVYVGGAFTTANSVTVNYVAKWNGTTFVALGSGLNGNCYALALDRQGRLYAGGAFTTADGATVNYVARWNGVQWEALGSGLTGSAVRTLAFDADGLLWVGGAFTSASGLALVDGVAIWNGSTWCHAPFNLPTTGVEVQAIATNQVTGMRYLGHNGTGTSDAQAGNTTVTNGGSARAMPRFWFKRSGGTSARVEFIKNESSGATIWLNYSLLDGESLELDLTGTRKRAVSSYFGDVTGRAVLRNSDLAGFDLLPGANYLTVFVNTAGTPTMEAWVGWRNTHWGSDSL